MGKYQSYIREVKETAKNNGISIKFSRSKHLIQDGKCVGYFSLSPLKLAVAVGKPLNKWFHVFIHESCHMNQYLEGGYVGKFNSADVVFGWVGGQNYHDTDIKFHIDELTDLELDCEMRTVQKIKEHGFTAFNVKQYTQQANAYIFYYQFLKKTRDWEMVSKTRFKKVWSQAPTTFNCNYRKIPRKLLKAYKKFCLP